MKMIIVILIILPTLAKAQAPIASAPASASTALQTANSAQSATATTAANGFQKTCTGSAAGAISCTYMVLAAANALYSLLGSNNGSAVTAGLTDATTASATPATTTASSGLAQQLQQAEDAALQTAASKGVTLSPDLGSVTLPNGATVPTSSLNNSQGLQAAGLTADQAAGVLANAAQVVAAAKSKYDVASMATDGGGGGGGAGNSRGTNGDEDGSNSKLKSLLSQFNKNRKPASMSGLSKKLGNTGESIGVAGDDIFQMISRQYKRKEQQNAFIKTP